MIRSLILLLVLGNSAFAQNMRTPESVEQAVQNELAASQQRLPAMAILATQYPEFLNAWRVQLRQQLIVGTGKQASASSDAIALAEAMNYANQYLNRADDNRVDAYFQQQRSFLNAARSDTGLCGRLLNTATARSDHRYSAPWLLDARYRKSLPAWQRAVSELILQAQDAQPRRLPTEQNQLFMQRLVSKMALRFGPDSLREYELIENDNANPATRCKAVWQVAETMQDQHLELRAHLVRIFFGR